MDKQNYLDQIIRGLTTKQAFEWNDRAEYLNDEKQDAFVRSILEKAGVPATQHNINKVSLQFEALIDISSETDFDQFEHYGS